MMRRKKFVAVAAKDFVEEHRTALDAHGAVAAGRGRRISNAPE
jgi:hypothetical protein